MTADEADSVMRLNGVRWGKVENVRLDGRLLNEEETAQALADGLAGSRFPLIEQMASLASQRKKVA
jgi:hypothetical protein